ncbi:type I methionyl aminopeptidase [Ferruginibacter lapsinanis]|uniref:type I methionyl aminopeptidase n=1 Tax=Ferruginibacter lapsinanis TaxID=563172 RepID=UPI001E626184|nr:type I methionyl aminopeptidase [Ferruginibacter lapsinanis]UEG49963.1 type I methionyl aminopeptidase [Ferruginibacter lapsinanis]
MVYYKTKEEIELMRISSLLVSKTLAEVAKIIKPGITTLAIDSFAEQFILDNAATPSFKGYGVPPFPFACCISVNDAVVHGFPTKNELKEGDIVSVDVGVFKNGFHGDSAYTFALAGVTDDVKKLLAVTKASLYKGIEKAVHGNRVGDISFAIQEYTEKQHGYGVVRDLVGHGLGRHLHEDPQVPNYGKRGTGAKLVEGMVIAIEPMINMGTKDVYHDKDGWTIRTNDGKAAAHYEHNVAIQKNKPDILSSFTEIEAAEKGNANLCSDY